MKLNLQRKLRSRAGASMIMALVFLLFCSFIGSSVLVSATANAYRVKHLADQQNQLTERSTALLLTDELQLNENENEQLQMNITDAFDTIQPVKVGTDGSVTSTGAAPTYQRTITFRVFTTDADINPAQRLMLEATVQRYLKAYPTHSAAAGLDPTTSVAQTIKLESFPAGGEPTQTISDIGEFWFKPAPDSDEIKGTITVTGTNITPLAPHSTIDVLPEYTVNFSSGSGSNLYDFYLDFGEFSQLKVTMNAFYSAITTADLKSAPQSVSGSAEVFQTTTTLTQTVISWDPPMIEKGGAAG